MLAAVFLTFVLCPFLFALTVPWSFWRAMISNSRRMDGTSSLRRRRREVRAVGKHFGNLLAPVMMSCCGIFAVSSYVFTEVMPPGLILRSFQCADLDLEQWKENLAEARQEYATFQLDRGATLAEIEAKERSLWREWPMLFFGAVLWVVISIGVFVRSASESALILGAGIRQRRKMYAQSDVNRMEERDDRARPVSISV